jgi:phosphatidylserine decarboxylase
MTLHKEGRKILLFSLIIFVGIFFLFEYALDTPKWVNDSVLVILIVLYLVILQFFRSPKFIINKDEKHVLAPADGKVVVIEDTQEDEYFKGKRKQISIFMSPINVHVNRSPISSLVNFCKNHAGKYLEKNIIVVENGNGVEVLFRQIAGAIARRIKCYVNVVDMSDQGGEFGFIKFGSLVDIYFPLDSAVKVNIGDKTKGGRTVIAKLKSEI